jgi:hypothetical protein
MNEANYACCFCGKLVLDEQLAILTVQPSNVVKWGAHRACFTKALFAWARVDLEWRDSL